MQAAKHPYTFPDELWLEILVDLKYSDLVKFMRVCKNFKKLIKVSRSKKYTKDEERIEESF